MTKFDEILDKTTGKDLLVINKIGDRANKLAKKQKIKIDQQSIEMDLVAVHGGIKKLDLKKLLNFDDFNFFHDIIGIKSHLNRKKIELKDCFLPRCSI